MSRGEKLHKRLVTLENALLIILQESLPAIADGGYPWVFIDFNRKEIPSWYKKKEQFSELNLLLKEIVSLRSNLAFPTNEGLIGLYYGYVEAYNSKDENRLGPRKLAAELLSKLNGSEY